ncbi:MAG: hypothetical protein ACNA7W_01745 [Pseudomonadales bacterium]
MSDSGDSTGSGAEAREAHYGGSIEQTLAGNADVEVMAIIKEAWARTEGLKAIVVGGMLLVYAAVALATVVLGSVFGFEDQTVVASTISQLVVMMIVYPFMAGVFMVGLRHGVGLPVSFQDQFAYYACLMPIVAVGLLQSVITSLGFLLLIVPGIYLSIALSLAVPLKAERDLPISECLLTSLRLVNRKFFEVAILSIVAVLLIVLGFVSLVGWIWTMPWTLMIFAILYRQLAGFQAGKVSTIAF